MSKIALLYLRVSTDRQAERGFSLPAQEEVCKTRAAADGYEIGHIFRDEGESARTDARPGLQALLDRCRQGGIDAVYVHQVSRLARNTIDHAAIVGTLRKKKIKLISATENIDETPEGKFTEGILAAMAEYQSLNLGRDVLKGMNQRAQQGLWNTKAGFGYKNVKEIDSDGIERKYVAPDPKTRDLAVKVFEMFATGQYTAIELTKWLYSQGIRQGRVDKPLSGSVICRMLKNPFYIGSIRWNGVEAKGSHVPLISRELFQRVQFALEDRVHGRSKKRKNAFLLRGIMICGECGGGITYEKQTTSSGRVISYYRCSKKREGHPVFCSQSYVETTQLEGEVLKALKVVRLPARIVGRIEKKLQEIHEREQTSVTKERRELTRKIEELDAKERALVNKYLENKLSEEIYETIREEVSSDRARCKARLEANQTMIQSAIQILERAVAFIRDLPKAYKRAPEPLKRQILAIVFKDLIVRDGKLYKAILNAPLDYLCKEFVHNKNIPVIFDGEAFGEPIGRVLEPARGRAKTAICHRNGGKKTPICGRIVLPIRGETRVFV
ncbi:MAG: recombinase family protein [Patescibacteria group bacterium]